MPTDIMPKRVFVQGVEYRISRDDSRLRGVRDKDGREGYALGFACEIDQIIGVTPDYGDGQTARECLLHEIVHTLDSALIPAWAVRAHKRRRPRSQLGKGASGRAARRMGMLPRIRPVHLNEQTVQAWSRGLYATLCDPRNRAFVSYVFQVDFPTTLFPG